MPDKAKTKKEIKDCPLNGRTCGPKCAWYYRTNGHQKCELILNLQFIAQELQTLRRNHGGF